MRHWMHYLQSAWLPAVARQISGRGVAKLPSAGLIKQTHCDYFEFIWPIVSCFLPRSWIDTAPCLLQFNLELALSLASFVLLTASDILALNAQTMLHVLQEEVWISVFVAPHQFGYVPLLLQSLELPVEVEFCELSLNIDLGTKPAPNSIKNVSGGRVEASFQSMSYAIYLFSSA